MMLETVQTREVVRRSLALAGSLHPSTHSAVQDVIHAVEVHYFEVLRVAGCVVDSAGINIRAGIGLEALLTEVAKQHSITTERNGRLTVYSDAQRALSPFAEGLWSVAAAVARAPSAHKRVELDQITFFVDACLVEVERMSTRLAADAMKRGIQKLAAARRYIPEVALPLHHIYAAGPVTKGEFSQLLGLGYRNSKHTNQVVAQLMADNVLIGGSNGQLQLDLSEILLPALLV